MSRADAAELASLPQAVYSVADRARRALAHERAGRFREAWGEWEALRATDPLRREWNAPLAASYLRFAFTWTSDGSDAPLRDAEEALVRGVAILTLDLSDQPDDVARLMLVARACEQRCILRAFGNGWTIAARDALEAGDAPTVSGDARQIRAAGVAATAALDLVALAAPSLTAVSSDLALSCLRLAATLEAAGAEPEASGLLKRAETVLQGPQTRVRAPRLIAIAGGADDVTATPSRRPQLRLVTSLTA